MNPTEERPLAVFYEHPEWFRPLFAELDRRGVPYVRLLAHRHHFDPDERQCPYALVVNRMSPSAWTRGHADAIPYTLEYLAHLEAIGANVFNGYQAYRYEFSKARQLGLMARLGLPHPRARAFNHPSQAPAAAEGLTFPVVVKPNIGGSGAGIRRFDTPEALRQAAEAAELTLGVDGVGLVQEYHRPVNGSIVRVEVLGGELLYAIRLRLVDPGSFNLCPADVCQVPGLADGVSGRGVPVEATEPPPEVVEAVLRLTQAAHIEVGGVEYLVSERDGQAYFYDVNALSNFVANAPDVVGFDPFVRLVDYLLVRAGMAAAAPVV